MRGSKQRDKAESFCHQSLFRNIFELMTDEQMENAPPPTPGGSLATFPRAPYTYTMHTSPSLVHYPPSEFNL